MGDNEQVDEGDRPLEQLVKDLAGSREMMSSLMQALILSLMEQLKSEEVLSNLLHGEQLPTKKVTLSEQCSCSEQCSSSGQSSPGFPLATG